MINVSIYLNLAQLLATSWQNQQYDLITSNLIMTKDVKWSTWVYTWIWHKYEPPHDKTNKMTCAPSEDWDQPGHPPSLIRVSAVRMKKAWVLSYPVSTQWRLWSDWVDALADLSLRWAHNHIVGFVTRRLKYLCHTDNDNSILIKMW